MGISGGGIKHGVHKKTVNYEVQARNQLEKDYENILESGSTMKIHISVIISGDKSEDFRQVLKK